MAKYSEFVTLLKNSTRGITSGSEITDETINDIFTTYENLSKDDRKHVAELLIRDYVECHKPILNERIKSRLELINRRENMRIRNHFIKTLITSLIAPITFMIILWLSIGFANDSSDLKTFYTNVISVWKIVSGL